MSAPIGQIPVCEGWRWHMARMHYFRDGESLCGKYYVRILGGGNKPRRPWHTTLPDGESACETCKSKVSAPTPGEDNK